MVLLFCYIVLAASRTLREVEQEILKDLRKTGLVSGTCLKKSKLDFQIRFKVGTAAQRTLRPLFSSSSF